MFKMPETWERGGLVLARAGGGITFNVLGDPCIVWDEQIGNWRMFLFADPPGHGQAICTQTDDIGPGSWQFVGPLEFTNPHQLRGTSTHKPFVVMEAQRPNRAALIDQRYCLLMVNVAQGQKLVQQAWAEDLAGPWTLVDEILIAPGDASAFDGKHVDAVTGFYFAERREILYFYMGYPQEPQQRAISPYGSAQGVATQRIGEHRATKGGVVLPPAQEPGHWAAGWVGGLQLLPGNQHRWIAIVNASPTGPRPDDQAKSREEPPPSLGGFAVCDADWPVSGWSWAPNPIEWATDIPPDALAAGEGTNFWRQHILVAPDGRLALFYNSGAYGQEQLYVKFGGR